MLKRIQHNLKMEEKTMRNLSLSIIAIMLLLLTGGCQEDKPQSQPTTEQATAQPRQEADKAKDAAPDEETKTVSVASSGEMATGQAVYEKTCSSCHTSGIAGAPKLGDKTAWAPLVSAGIDQMVQVAIDGKGAMPPKGGNPDLSNDEVRAAVNYMVEQSR
jgi:cytochrome c5